MKIFIVNSEAVWYTMINKKAYLVAAIWQLRRKDV